MKQTRESQLALVFAMAMAFASATNAQLGFVALATADLDANGVTDLVTSDGTSLRPWLGIPRPPWLVAGVRSPLINVGRVAERPTIVDDHVFIAYLDSNVGGAGRVDVYRFDGAGAARLVGQNLVMPTSPEARITSLHLLPAARASARTRVLATWSEWPATTSLRAAFFEPRGMSSAIDVGLSALAGVATHVYGLHQTHTPSPAAGLALAIVGAEPTSSRGGLGVVEFGEDLSGAPTVLSRVNWAGVPVPGSSIGLDAPTPTTMSGYAPFPGLGSPVVRMPFGSTVVFSPDGVPPFVSLTTAQVIPTTLRGEMFGRATADFDGDGGAELVLFERFYGIPDAYLVLLSPHLRTAPVVQRWDRDPIQDAIATDVDGDGRMDLVLATFRYRRSPELFLMRGQGGTLLPPVLLGSG